MEQHITQFLAELSQQRKLSDNTTAAYRTDLEQFVAFLEERGISEWDQVQHDDLMSFQIYLRDRAYAKSTVARRTAALKSFFTFLLAQHMVTSDPTEQIDAPRVERPAPHALTPAQVDELLELPLRYTGPERLRDKAMLELLYATGMRVSELVSLEMSDVDLSALQVRCAGRAGRDRTLPIGQSVYTALEEYFDNARGQLARASAEPDTALFLNHRGKRLTRQGFWLILKGYAGELGLTELTPHTLRHSFAAHMVHDGADLREVQQRLGHASLSTTQIYTQMAHDDPTPRDGVPLASVPAE